ncbi:MAG: response regulator [Magnetococcales bacterium]|nr:response regulator [Magnetococcales bacterium]
MEQDFYTVVLIVDDDESNREMLEELLEDEGYKTAMARDGVEALELLEADPNLYGTILLDRMMPRMNGMELLRIIKQNELLCRIPVVMQTANALLDERLEGMRAGAWQYITKPFEIQEVLVAVQVAIKHYQDYKALEQQLLKNTNPKFTITQSSHEFSSMDDIHELATTLAQNCPDPNRVLLGLVELLNNAIEHGNLGITYNEKKQWLKKGTWYENINIRYQLVENSEKKASVTFKRSEKQIQFLIEDQGDGFEWEKYMQFDSSRVLDPNGRGIAMAMALSFDKIIYHGKGNVVQAIVDL